MKQWITTDQWQELNTSEQEFITSWKQRKNYPTAEMPTVGILLELLIAITYNFREEDSDGRFFNKILINAESSVGWDGHEFIDILWYEVKQAIHKRLITGTIIEPLASEKLPLDTT